MDQMPVPIPPAPHSSQTARVQPPAAVTRPARSSAAYDANMAINTERATSAKLYEPIKFTAAISLHPVATRNRRAALQLKTNRLPSASANSCRVGTNTVGLFFRGLDMGSTGAVAPRILTVGFGDSLDKISGSWDTLIGLVGT